MLSLGQSQQQSEQGESLASFTSDRVRKNNKTEKKKSMKYVSQAFIQLI